MIVSATTKMEVLQPNPTPDDAQGRDEESVWLDQARAGDADAFARLAEAHEARLYRQAVALCGSATDAEDLATETLIEAWRGLGRFRGGCRFSTWLYAILVHRHQKHLRRGRSRLPSASDFRTSAQPAGREPIDSADGASGLAALAESESLAVLRGAVEALGPRHRAVICLRFFENASIAEIAAALDIPAGTVKSRLFHGLAALRTRPEVVNLLTERGDIWV